MKPDAPQEASSEMPVARKSVPAKPTPKPAKPKNEFYRAANEDDDGYDPYSDRRPTPEPLFERDPWN